MTRTQFRIFLLVGLLLGCIALFIFTQYPKPGQPEPKINQPPPGGPLPNITRNESIWNESNFNESLPVTPPHIFILRYHYTPFKPLLKSDWLTIELQWSLHNFLYYCGPILKALGHELRLVFYANNFSDPTLNQTLALIFNTSQCQYLKCSEHLEIINFDTHPQFNSESPIMKILSAHEKDPVKVMFAKRFLGDILLLDSNHTRLMIGCDVFFIAPPLELFLEALLEEKMNQVWYATDTKSFEGKYYRIHDYNGSQCEGLLGDFVMISPGTKFDLNSTIDLFLYYWGLKDWSKVIDPPVPRRMDVALSRAADQWIQSITYGKWALNKKALPKTKYFHRIPGDTTKIEDAVMIHGHFTHLAESYFKADTALFNIYSFSNNQKISCLVFSFCTLLNIFFLL